MEAGTLGRSPLKALLDLLQKNLAQSEKFTVLSNDHKGKSSGIKYLGKPFKLRLTRAEGESNVEDFSSNVVGIEPLASIAAIEEFLWSKIQSTASITTDNISDDEIVIEDTMDAIEFEEEQDSESILEVEPPQNSLRLSGAVGQPNPSTTSSLTIDDKNIPRLSFTYCGNQLYPSDNIFAVIQKQYNEETNDGSSGIDQNSNITPASKIWNKEHIMFYTFNKQKRRIESPKNTIQDPEIMIDKSIMEHFMENNLYFKLSVPDSLKDILLLLNFINSYMNLWQPKSEKIRDSRRNNDISNELIASKISLKLSQQLSDTLLLCCGEFPKWCNFVTKCSPYLIPFECRRQYFICSSLGIARALHSLQGLPNSSSLGDDNDERFSVGRIQLLKLLYFYHKVP